MSIHDPQLTKVTVASIGRRFLFTCPCGNTPSKPLDHEDAKTELARHPMAPSDATRSEAAAAKRKHEREGL